jgi:hypothetical protein
MVLRVSSLEFRFDSNIFFSMQIPSLLPFYPYLGMTMDTYKLSFVLFISKFKPKITIQAQTKQIWNVDTQLGFDNSFNIHDLNSI